MSPKYCICTSTYLVRSVLLCCSVATVVWYPYAGWNLLKPLNNPSLLLPYEQYYIQSLHQAGRLIPEQSPGETNPLFQTAINPQPPHPTWAEATLKRNANTHRTRYVEVQIQYFGDTITTCYTIHSITIRHHVSHTIETYSLIQPYTSRPTTP